MAKSWAHNVVLKEVKVTKPIGVAEWESEIVEKLSEELKRSVPTTEEIEAELARQGTRGRVRRPPTALSRIEFNKERDMVRAEDTSTAHVSAVCFLAAVDHGQLVGREHAGPESSRRS